MDTGSLFVVSLGSGLIFCVGFIAVYQNLKKNKSGSKLNRPAKIPKKKKK